MEVDGLKCKCGCGEFIITDESQSKDEIKHKHIQYVQCECAKCGKEHAILFASKY